MGGGNKKIGKRGDNVHGRPSRAYYYPPDLNTSISNIFLKMKM
jgi:hypothetical protein